ncbi:MAG: hypothetical protein Q8918_19130 [Bacteroidota bacterium]|nr:hypothetical protein [Bacteroidota bacterium]MDP4252219.1 hypothetical protein [Bacteroidota bacterium]
MQIGFEIELLSATDSSAGGGDGGASSSGGASSDWAILTGQGITSFDNWVNQSEAYVDAGVANAPFVNLTKAMFASSPNNAIKIFGNNEDGTWSTTEIDDVTSAHMTTSRSGVEGIAYTSSVYAVEDGTDEDLTHQTNNSEHVVGGFIKYNTYGLFDPTSTIDGAA